MLAQRNALRASRQFRPTFDRLEARDCPAIVYGLHNGQPMFYDDGVAVSDIQHVQVQAPVIPSIIHAVVAPVTENADGTINVTVQITTAQGNNTAASLGAGLLATIPGPAASLSGVEQSHLVGIQASPGSVNVAYAAYSPGESFTTASFTMTFHPSTEPTLAFTVLSPDWLGTIDSSALDAYFAQH